MFVIVSVGLNFNGENTMKRILLLIALLVFVACGSAETDPQIEEVAVEESSADVPTDEGTVADETMSDDESMADDTTMSDDAVVENPDAMTEEDAMADSDDAMHDDDAMADDDAMVDDDDVMHDDMIAEDETAMVDDDVMHDDMMTEGDAMADDAMVEEETMVDTSNLPAWQTLPLTNAHTGETFTLSDFAGKTVFVEPMATWCTNCLRQLGNVQAAKAETGDDVVFIGLSLETTLTNDNLAAYADKHGFDFFWAVLTPEMVRELAGEFGQTITNPPSTPHFIIRPNGTVSIFTTGIEPASDLLDQISLAQNS